MRLQSKVAVLTGAAAALPTQVMGFGGAAANLFVREGAKVFITDIRDELGERSAAALRAQGHDARYLRLDVTNEQNWAQVIAAVMAASASARALAKGSRTWSLMRANGSRLRSPSQA